MENMKRSVTCGALRASDEGRNITLNGWVHRHRDHGGIRFFDIRDRYGLTQVVVNADAPAELRAASDELKFEYCVAVEGTVHARPPAMANPNMPTGEIEVHASKIAILSRCDVLPFMVDEKADAKEDTRLKYRYLDLRTGTMQRNIALRHRAALAAREFLSARGFFEIETPIFIKSTPEGARDYLVPSRLNPGKFYALPQSPQLYKQILMVSGFDRYFQIARCFRDEDARGDRQPEFTQIDIEMSFVSREDVFELVEGLFLNIFTKSIGREITVPFPRIAYDEAMNLYGSDKPDLRFDLKMQDFGSFARKGAFEVFKKVVEGGGVVKALVAPGCAEYSRKQITDLEAVAKVYGAAGLAWMKVTEAGLEGGISKFYAEHASAIRAALGAKAGDLILMVGADFRKACLSLGAVRVQLGRDLKLVGHRGLQVLLDHRLPPVRVERGRQEVGPRAPHVHHAPGKVPGGLRKETRGSEGRSLRPGVQRGRAGVRLHQDPRPRAPEADLPIPWHFRRAGRAAIRLPAGGFPLRPPAARWNRSRFRPAGGNDGRGVHDSRSYPVSQEYTRPMPYG